MYRNLPWLPKYYKNLNHKNLPHAFLIGGKNGVGKSDLTFLLTNKILCDVKNKESSCGVCQSCKFFLSSNHPDFYHVKLEEGKKNISINQIKSLQNKFYESSFLGGNKVFFIELIEFMSRDASDSLLKILEEPPNNTFFILTSARAKQISPTIRSRCAEINITPPTQEEIQGWLVNSNFSSSEFNTLQCLAPGRPLKIETLLKEDLLSTRTTFIKQISVLIKSGDNIISLSEKWAKDEESLPFLLEWMSLLLMDAMRFQSTLCHKIISKDTENIALFLGEKVSFDVMYDLLTLTNGLWSQITKGTNLKLEYQLRSLFVDWEEKLGISIL